MFDLFPGIHFIGQNHHEIFRRFGWVHLFLSQMRVRFMDMARLRETKE